MTINSNNTSDINTALLYMQNKIKTLSGSQSDYATENDTSLKELQTQQQAQLQQVNSLIIPVGSQVIYDSWSGAPTTTGRGYVLGQYYNRLIEGVFTGLTTPDGYHKTWRLTQQTTASQDTYVGVSLNDFIHTDKQATFSFPSYRVLVGSQWFTNDDIAYETTMGYSQPGINLYMEWTRGGPTGGAINVYNVTIHGAYQRD